jgi:hypothetical protein
MKHTIMVAAFVAALSAGSIPSAAAAAPLMVQQQNGAQKAQKAQAQKAQKQQGPSRPQQAQNNGGQKQKAQKKQGPARPQQAQNNAAQKQKAQKQQNNAAQKQKAQKQQGPARPQQAQRGGPQQALQNRGSVRQAQLPPGLQRLRTSGRSSDRLVAGAAAAAAYRGIEAGWLDVRQQNDVVFVRNPRGDLLLDLDERRARELGHWDLRRLGDRRAKANGPAFCRSGEGHPVWGREWCLDKGFGLGSRNGTIWSRTRVDDVVFRRTTDRDRLVRDVLIGAVGDVVFNRLAFHALTMGYQEPLHGYWVAEPNSPRILHVYSGDVAVAELVDLDRNDRVDVLYVVQPL